MTQQCVDNGIVATGWQAWIMMIFRIRIIWEIDYFKSADIGNLVQERYHWLGERPNLELFPVLRSYRATLNTRSRVMLGVNQANHWLAWGKLCLYMCKSAMPCMTSEGKYTLLPYPLSFSFGLITRFCEVLVLGRLTSWLGRVPANSVLSQNTYHQTWTVQPTMPLLYRSLFLHADCSVQIFVALFNRK